MAFGQIEIVHRVLRSIFGRPSTDCLGIFFQRFLVKFGLALNVLIQFPGSIEAKIFKNRTEHTS